MASNESFLVDITDLPQTSLNSTAKPYSNVSFWGTTSNISNEPELVTNSDFITLSSTFSPKPIEPPCERYWYDLNTTSVLRVSQGQDYRQVTKN